jgi:peptidyl-tRNA hydrolase, PTH1 family
MFFFVGLGNPGEQYAQTRHNAGFLLADFLAQELGAKWENQRKVASMVAKTEKALLLKPQTYMNDSGVAVAQAVRYYKLSPQQQAQIWVGFDDLDLALGSFKAQFGKGPKVHNGLLSVYEHLGTDQFWHLRIGVDGRAGDRSIPGHAYVLQSFLPSEQQQLQTVYQTATETMRKHW